MRYCKNCDLKFDGLQEKCIFCNNELEILDDTYSTGFPKKKPYPAIISLIKRTTAFILLLAVTCSILLNIYLFKDKMYWLLVLFSSVYIYFITYIATDFSKNVVGKIELISFITSLETMGIFIFFDIGFKSIMLTYIYPGIILLDYIAIFVFFAISNGKKAHDYIVYILLNILWGITPVFFLLFKIVTPTWPSSMCIAISIIILLGLLLFERKNTKEELKRRLHM